MDNEDEWAGYTDALNKHAYNDEGYDADLYRKGYDSGLLELQSIIQEDSIFDYLNEAYD